MSVKLYYLPSILTFVRGPGQASPLSRIDFKRGTQPEIEIISLGSDQETAEELPDAASMDMRLGVKPLNIFDTDPYVYSELFTKPGGGSYLVSPVFDSAKLDTDLGVDSSDTNDKPYVDGYLEFFYALPGQYPVKSLSLPCRIFNDVVRGTEAIPATALSYYPPVSAISDVIVEAVRFVDAPTAGADFSMFDGGDAPTAGAYLAFGAGHLYSFHSTIDSVWKRNTRATF